MDSNYEDLSVLDKDILESYNKVSNGEATKVTLDTTRYTIKTYYVSSGLIRIDVKEKK